MGSPALTPVRLPSYKLDDFYFDVALPSNKVHRTDPDDFEQLVIGYLSCFPEEDDDNLGMTDPIPIGSVQASLLDVGSASFYAPGAATPPFHVYDLFDAISGDWAAAIELFNDIGEPSQAMVSAGVNAPVFHVLMIDDVWLLPGHQDKRMDLVAIQALIDRFVTGNANSIALVNLELYTEAITPEDVWTRIKEGKEVDEDAVDARSITVEELAARFIHLGFAPVGGSTFFVRAGDKVTQHPEHILDCPLPKLPSPEEMEQFIRQVKIDQAMAPEPRKKHGHKRPKQKPN